MYAIDMRTRQKIGPLIRTHRKAKGWSQRELGEKVGLSGAMISVIEKGDSPTTLDKLDLLSDVLDLGLRVEQEPEKRAPELEELLTLFPQLKPSIQAIILQSARDSVAASQKQTA